MQLITCRLYVVFACTVHLSGHLFLYRNGEQSVMRDPDFARVAFEEIQRRDKVAPPADLTSLI